MLILDAYNYRDLQTISGLLGSAAAGDLTLPEVMDLVNDALLKYPFTGRISAAQSGQQSDITTNRCPWCGCHLMLCGESSRLVGAPVYTCRLKCGYSVIKGDL